MRKMKVRNNSEEWMDGEIYEGIRGRDKKFKLFKRTRLRSDFENYKTSRNNLQNLIKRKKKAYVTQRLDANIANPKKLWTDLKKLGMPPKKEKQQKICLGENSQLIFDNKEISEKFKSFYCSLSDSLLEKLPAAPGKFKIDDVKNYYRHLNLQQAAFKFTPTTHQEILKILKELDEKKAVGLDNINAKL